MLAVQRLLTLWPSLIAQKLRISSELVDFSPRLENKITF
jgi:hypothetical protein